MNNTIHQTLLKLMVSATSKDPMAFDKLLKLTAYQNDILNEALTQLYQQRSINCCQITKLGITQMVYWPTSIIDKPINLHRLYTKPIDKTLSPAPRRSEANPNQQKAPTMQNIDVSNNDVIDNEKPPVWRMVKLIMSQTETTAKQLAELIGEKYASNIPSRLNYLCQGKDPIIKVEKTFDANKKPHYLFKACPGKTFDDYIARKATRAEPVKNNQTNVVINVTTPDAKSFAESQSLNNFVSSLISDQTPSAQVQQIMKSLADTNESGATPASNTELHESKQISQPIKNIDSIIDDSFLNDDDRRYSVLSDKEPFKCAITTQKTLIIFGVSYQPIELNHLQTKELANFLNELEVTSFVI